MNAQSSSRQVIDPTSRPLWVGRGPGVDVILHHPKVVRKHAVLLRIAGALQVTDRSGGATFVNGKQIREAVLRDGDLVVFGAVPFQVENGKLLGLVDGGGIALRVDKLTVEVQSSGNTIRLLDNISITIEPGQFVGLLGPSGAGKTTLLRCLIGYTKPASGSIHADHFELPDQAAGFWPQAGFVPQNDILFSTLSVRENLDFALQLRAPSLDRRERQELIGQRLMQLGLESRADIRLEKLSGGEKKRVSVAIETLSKPRALFLDEPTAGLDPANETRIMNELRLLAQGGTTVICATHVLENVLKLHRAIVLVDGRIAYDDPPAGLLKHFGVTTYPELYEPRTLSSRRPKVLSTTESAYPKPSAPKQLPPPIGIIRQIRVQVARGVRLISRDRGWSIMLLAQPILMAFLINLSQAGFDEVNTVYTFAAVTAVWLGLNNTAREIVRERRHYVRERLLGVSPGAYLTAKIILFAVLGIGQIAVLVGIIRYLNFCDADRQRDLTRSTLVEVFLALWGAYLSSALLGLLVSALARTEEWAVSLLPMIVLPQILLTGQAADMHKAGRFHSFVYLLNRTGQPQRSWQEWTVEAASFVTYTRPCVAMLRKPFLPEERIDAERLPSLRTARTVNYCHMFGCILLSGVALWLVFRVRDQLWIRSLT